MARLPRIILANTPHHVTQRGNRKQQTFFCETDYRFYLRSLRELSFISNVEISAFCLMPNHVHLVLTPPSREALILLVSDLHKRYTSYINYKMGWKGHLWQGRFHSVVLSPEHYENCIYYVEQNPVRAQIVEDFRKYPWSSKKTSSYHSSTVDADFAILREMTRTGRPRGSETFLSKISKECGVDPTPKKRGRKKINS